jgi:cobalt-precorrin-5B (C1)-methyltransferase
MTKQLRSGYTTGACAAAAAKAAALLLKHGEAPTGVEIPFPDHSRHSFWVHQALMLNDGARASVIKDAGDDPDVTNGAEIGAVVRYRYEDTAQRECCIQLDTVELCGGAGVGFASKPGLAVAVGEPAINPVPRQMIADAVREVIADKQLHVEIFIHQGLALAQKTLNRRLGIIGGLSVLGTTGIVRPVSADAWTATIKASMNVARKAGLDEVVLSTGRTSERGAQSELDLPEEAYAMMGDYLEFSLKEAARQGFVKIHLAAMWAKITKAALKVPQTHVRNGALEMKDAAGLLADLGAEGELLQKIKNANTAREMHEHLHHGKRQDIIRAVCQLAQDYGREVTGKAVEVYLVNSKAEVIEHV